MPKIRADHRHNSKHVKSRNMAMDTVLSSHHSSHFPLGPQEHSRHHSGHLFWLQGSARGQLHTHQAGCAGVAQEGAQALQVSHPNFSHWCQSCRARQTCRAPAPAPASPALLQPPAPPQLGDAGAEPGAGGGDRVPKPTTDRSPSPPPSPSSLLHQPSPPSALVFPAPGVLIPTPQSTG